jgi:hypothetical protein
MSGSVDPVVGVAQVLSVFVGAATAAAIAPHLVVLIAGMAGGVLGLMSWRKSAIWEGVVYVTLAGIGAWVFTGTAADFIYQYLPSTADKRLIAPLAFCIGFVGHRWTQVFRWATRIARSTAEEALKRGK